MQVETKIPCAPACNHQPCAAARVAVRRAQRRQFFRQAVDSAYLNAVADPIGVAIEVYEDEFDIALTREAALRILERPDCQTFAESAS